MFFTEPVFFHELLFGIFKRRDSTNFMQAIDINPNNANYFNRGLAKFFLEDYQGAILDFTEAIELYSKDEGSYYYRGFAKLKLNQKENACLDLSKAGELGFPDAYETIKEYCN